MANEPSGKTLEQIDSQDTLVVEMMSEPASRGVDEGDRAALRSAYTAAQLKDRNEHQAKLDKEVKALTKISERYGAQLQQAAKNEGLDLDELKARLRSMAAITDDERRQQEIGKLHDTYAPTLMQVINRVGIDRATTMREAMESLAVPAHAKPLKDHNKRTEGTRALRIPATYEEGLIGGGWYTDPPPAPAPQYTTTTLTAPYGLRATLGGATADAATGKIQDRNEIWVGSSQHLASVGSTFFADASIRRVRVEATIDLSYSTVIGAILGYASAEVLLNLKVLNGTQVVGSNRLSLLRQWGVVYWVTSQSGSGTYTLACEFDHSYGTPRTYAAIGELETWTGGGGVAIISPATASGSGSNQRMNVTLIK